jgi:hypothetical protein
VPGDYRPTIQISSLALAALRNLQIELPSFANVKVLYAQEVCRNLKG